MASVHARTVAVVLALATTASTAQEIPRPAVEGVEPRVRDLLLDRYRALEQHPADGGAWGRYGVVLDAHQQVRAARQAYRRAAELDEGDFRWPYYLAAAIELENPSEALRWYEQALAIDGNYAPAHIRFAEALEKVGRADDARRHFERAQELDGTLPLAPFGLGRIALAAGDVDSALRLLERADRLDGKVQAIKATLARAAFLSGDERRARRLAAAAQTLPRMTHHRDSRRAAVRSEAVDSASYLQRARTLHEVGQQRQALVEIGKLLEHEPANAPAHLLAASIHDVLGDAERAADSAHRALESDPELRGARPVLAGALFKLRRLEQAERQARRVLSDDPQNFHMLLLLGLMVAERGAVADMVGLMDRAYEARNADPELRALLRQMELQLAQTFADVGQRQEAASRMERVLVLAREDGASKPVLEALQHQLDSYRH